MSDIEFKCPKCVGQLVVDSRGAGMTVSCPHCGGMICIPALKSASKIRIPLDATAFDRGVPLKSENHVETPVLPDLAQSKPLKRKYEFTGETRDYSGRILRRIVRLCDGQIGGWVENESNLSHEGNCWVYDEATVFENAVIRDDAQVSATASVHGGARVSGHARVTGNANIYGHAHVCESAVVTDDSCVGGNEVISGNARITSSSILNPLKAPTPKDALVAVGLNALGLLTFSTSGWLKKKYNERPR